MTTDLPLGTVIYHPQDKDLTYPNPTKIGTLISRTSATFYVAQWWAGFPQARTCAVLSRKELKDGYWKLFDTETLFFECLLLTRDPESNWIHQCRVRELVREFHHFHGNAATRDVLERYGHVRKFSDLIPPRFHDVILHCSQVLYARGYQ